jgi:hypothetical protein
MGRKGVGKRVRALIASETAELIRNESTNQK